MPYSPFSSQPFRERGFTTPTHWRQLQPREYEDNNFMRTCCSLSHFNVGEHFSANISGIAVCGSRVFPSNVFILPNTQCTTLSVHVPIYNSTKRLSKPPFSPKDSTRYNPIFGAFPVAWLVRQFNTINGFKENGRQFYSNFSNGTLSDAPAVLIVWPVALTLHAMDFQRTRPGRRGRGGHGSRPRQS